jgi:hypothetical protein
MNKIVCIDCGSSSLLLNFKNSSLRLENEFNLLFAQDSAGNILVRNRQRTEAIKYFNLEKCLRCKNTHPAGITSEEIYSGAELPTTAEIKKLKEKLSNYELTLPFEIHHINIRAIDLKLSDFHKYNKINNDLFLVKYLIKQTWEAYNACDFKKFTEFLAEIKSHLDDINSRIKDLKMLV